MKRLVLIDGKSVFYRGYYAMGALSLSDGTPTGGVYGFAAIAMEIVKKLSPDKVVVAWDSRTSTAKRRAIFAEYKAGRVKPGEDFYAQIPLLRELVSDLGWEFVEIPEYEADDIIGTLARQAQGSAKLLSRNAPSGPSSRASVAPVEPRRLKGSSKATFTEPWETYIISSDLDMLQIVDENTHMWRILKGFTNIEEINVPEIEAKYGILKTQFLDLKALKGDASDNIPGVPGIGEKGAAKLLNQYGDLDGIYAHIGEIKGAVHDKLVAGKESAYMSRDLARIMFDAPVALSDLKDFEFDENRVIKGLKKLEFNSLLRKFKLGESENNAFEEPLSRRGSTGATEPRNDGREGAFRKSVISDFPEFIDWNVKSLMHRDEGVAGEILAGAEFWDLSQAAFLLNPLGREEPRLVVPEEKYQEQQAEFEKQPRLFKIYMDFDLPLVPILYKMEKKGMLIDREYFAKSQKEYTAEVATLEREIWALARKEFNVNSPIQLSEILFVDLGLPVKGVKKTTRGYSTGAKELDKLEKLHPIIGKLKEYREAAKLLSTYIVPMSGLADKEGRIHTTFTQNVTATGRLSSKDPNLQNIPVRTEEGKRIRTGFVAPSGRKLVSADYSQFELRLAAVLAGDAALVEDFNNGVDIHTKTASEAFGVPIAEVTKQQRRAAKAINFGIIYGMSVKGLSEAAGMPIAEAKKFIENYFELRAPIKRMLDGILKQAREQGYVETYYGRRRPTPDVKSANFVIRQAAERAAANMPIQGTEADLMKRAMINVDKALPSGAELVMQVHDSLIVECDVALVSEVSEILRREMEGVAPELKIKLAVEVTVGDNWGEL